MRHTSLVAVALLAGFVAPQTSPDKLDDPNNSGLTDQLRASWCNGQQNVCKLLCDSKNGLNTCTPSTLNYTCTCASNSSSPDLADYIDSMPYRICEKSYDLCIQAHPNDQAGQDNCQNNIRAKCGTLHVENYTAAASASSASASATAASSGASGAASTAASASGTGSSTGSATAAATSATKSSAAVAAMTIGREYGSGIIAAGIVAAFGFML